jgi:endonuclease YncB( thermonuclease family)
LAVAFFAVALPCFAYQTRVVGITDGDTLKVLHDHHEIRIRLAEIDAPEKRQPFGMRSKQSLSGLCYGVTADIEPVDTDRYGRTVSHVECRGMDASTGQVRTGMAWVYDRYVTPRSLYMLQEAARKDHIGLWSDPRPDAPWKWRLSWR